MGKNIKQLKIKNLFYYFIIILIVYFIVDILFFHHNPTYNNSPTTSSNNTNTTWVNQNRPSLVQYQNIANQIINDASNVSYPQMGSACNSLSAYINSNQISFPNQSIQAIFVQAIADYRGAITNCLSGISLYSNGKSTGSATTFDQSATDIVNCTNLLKQANGLINQII